MTHQTSRLYIFSDQMLVMSLGICHYEVLLVTTYILKVRYYPVTKLLFQIIICALIHTELYIRMNIELSAIILHFYYTGFAFLPYGSQPADTVVAYSVGFRFDIIFLLHVLCCHPFKSTCVTR